MSSTYTFHAGEATVLTREGQFTDAMPEILIGRTDGPVGQAFANMMAQSKGHTAMFAIRACKNNEPSIEELVANRHTIRHDMDDWS
jgi:formaldehyde-activating enzyme involved in methanogenesis